jgi:hypothetical protein
MAEKAGWPVGCELIRTASLAEGYSLGTPTAGRAEAERRRLPAYTRALKSFLDWCQQQGVSAIAGVQSSANLPSGSDQPRMQPHVPRKIPAVRTGRADRAR